MEYCGVCRVLNKVTLWTDLSYNQVWNRPNRFCFGLKQQIEYGILKDLNGAEHRQFEAGYRTGQQGIYVIKGIEEVPEQRIKQEFMVRKGYPKGKLWVSSKKWWVSGQC